MSTTHQYNLRKRPGPVQDATVARAPKVRKVTPTEDKTKADTKLNSVTKPKIEIKSKTETKTRIESKSKPETKQKQETKQKLEIKSKTDTKLEGKQNALIFGQDSCGEFGLSRMGIMKKMPIEFKIKEIKQIACGPMHIVCLDKEGRIYTNGCNDEGALGRITDGDEVLESTPTLVPIANPVTKVTVGDSHTAVLTDKMEVFVMGNFRDEGGQVGLTPESKGGSSFEPIQLLPDKKFKDIASGSNHMLLVDDKGVVYSFGTGEQGQLGRIHQDEAARVSDENRKLLLTPMKVDLKNVDPQRPFICDAVYAGNYSSFATNTDKKKNRLAGWGLNNYYQLGYKGLKGQLVQYIPKRSTFTCSTSMINVACGQHHTLFLTRTGRVYAAGRNEYGMLGIGKTPSEVCPARLIESLGNDIVDMTASINTSFAVNSDGNLFSWGMGGIQLGHGNEDDVFKPTKVESLSGKKVRTVSSGTTFTAVVTE